MNINGYQYRRVQCGLPDWVSCTAAFSRAPRARLCAARSHTRTSECGGSFSFRIARNQTAIHLSDMPTTWRHTFYSPRRILHRRKIKGLDQSGLARADWIAKPSDGRAADAITYNQTTCSTGAMPTQQSSAADTMGRACSPTWQASTPTQLHKLGNKD